MMRKFRNDRSDDLHLTGPERASATYDGTSGNDVYVGTGDADTINGYGGSDTLSGGDGDDTIDGGDDNDTIDGGAGRNVLRGGAGYNTIISTGGIDTVIGTGYSDYWIGRYSRSTENLAFDSAAGTLSNGTTLTGIDDVSLSTGYGNDTFNLSSTRSFYLDAGGSRDSAQIDYSALTAGRRSSGLSAAFNAAGDTFALKVTDEATRARNTIVNVENIGLVGSRYGDVFDVSGNIETRLLQLAIDGGSGSDRLNLDLHAASSTRFEVQGDGSILSSFGSFTNLETFRLVLGGGTNVVTLGSGNDTIVSAGSNDRLDGGAGDDTLSVSGLNASIEGGDGIDTWLITGVDGLTFDQATLTDSLGTTVAGIEQVAIRLSGDRSSGGVYTLTGSGTPVSVEVDSTANAIVFDLANRLEAVTFAAGRVYPDGVSGFEYSVGTARVFAPGYLGAAAIAIVGTGFDDTFRFRDGAHLDVVSLDGGAGIDTLGLTITDPRESVTLTVRNDGSIRSSLGDLAGLERFDLTLDGGGHVITTGRGDDQITISPPDNPRIVYRGNLLAGGGGDDTITATNSDDQLSGGNGDDLLIAGSGNDVLAGGAGRDILDGGIGRDTASYVDAESGVRVILLDGFQNTGGAGKDLLSSIEIVVGSRYDDALTGNAGDNRLVGSNGDDRLSGEVGDDQLVGGYGVDRLTGGSGADIFVFVSFGDIDPVARDRVLDFSGLQGDRIDLSLLDPDPAADDQTFTFIDAAAFSGNTDLFELRGRDRGDGSVLVEGDTNHDGHADFAILVVTAEPLTAADFIL